MAGVVLFGKKRASECGGSAEQREEVCRDDGGAQPRSFALARQSLSEKTIDSDQRISKLPA